MNYTRHVFDIERLGLNRVMPIRPIVPNLEGYNNDSEIKLFVEESTYAFMAEIKQMASKPEHKQYRKITYPPIPLTWVDHIKMDFKRWIPKWVLRRWPTKTKTLTHQTIIDIRRMCPHLDTRGKTSHVEFLTYTGFHAVEGKGER